MKALRFIAGILLVISGILHIAGYIQAPNDPGSIGTLIFGIIYTVTGILLFTSQKYPLFMGLILPLVGMIAYLIKFGFPDRISIMALLLLVDLIVIVSCAYLILKKVKREA